MSKSSGHGKSNQEFAGLYNGRQLSKQFMTELYDYCIGIRIHLCGGILFVVNFHADSFVSGSI